MAGESRILNITLNIQEGVYAMQHPVCGVLVLRLADSRQDAFCCVSTSVVPSLLGAELQPLADLQEQTLNQQFSNEDDSDGRTPYLLMPLECRKKGFPTVYSDDTDYAGEVDDSSKLPLPKELWWLLLHINKQTQQHDRKRAVRVGNLHGTCKGEYPTNFVGDSGPAEKQDCRPLRHCSAGTSCSSSRSSSSLSSVSVSPERRALDIPQQHDEKGYLYKSGLVRHFDLTDFLYNEAGLALFSLSMWRYPWMQTCMSSARTVEHRHEKSHHGTISRQGCGYSVGTLNEEMRLLKLCLEYGTPIPSSLTLNVSLMVR